MCVSVHMYLFDKRDQESDGLDRLPQTHFVGEDGVGVLSPGESEPVESLQLVAVESSVAEEWRLLYVLL